MYNKPEAEHYGSLLRTLVLEAGKMARAMKAEATVEEKADRSLVTAADIAVTNMMKERLGSILKQDNHILIDEESVDDLPPVEEALTYDYQWVLDPIDGTAPYSAGLPFWAVSLGLMRKGEPWLGAVYVPDMDELFWTDGKGNVMFQKGACGAAEAKKLKFDCTKAFKHTPVAIEGMFHDDYKYNLKFVHMASSVANGALFASSSAAGYVYRAWIWDNAALLAIYNVLGLKTVHWQEDKEFKKFDTNILNGNWSMKEPYITALPENIGLIRSEFEYIG